jgi:hypothetical protein
MTVQTRVVRLKPHALTGGTGIDRYTVAGLRFEVGQGWYEVPASLANILANVHIQVEDPNSPLAFDICDDRAAAVAYEERLRRAEAEAVASAAAPRVVEWGGAVRQIGDLTTDDLPRPGQPLRQPPPAPPRAQPSVLTQAPPEALPGRPVDGPGAPTDDEPVEWQDALPTGEPTKAPDEPAAAPAPTPVPAPAPTPAAPTPRPGARRAVGRERRSP